MSDTRHLLERQAAWQKNRAALPWAKKIRMVEAMQGTLRQLRDSRNKLRDSRFQDSTKPSNSEIT
jgi:hypothetical protein